MGMGLAVCWGVCVCMCVCMGRLWLLRHVCLWGGVWGAQSAGPVFGCAHVFPLTSWPPPLCTEPPVLSTARGREARHVPGRHHQCGEGGQEQRSPGCLRGLHCGWCRRGRWRRGEQGVDHAARVEGVLPPLSRTSHTQHPVWYPRHLLGVQVPEVRFTHVKCVCSCHGLASLSFHAPPPSLPIAPPT